MYVHLFESYIIYLNKLYYEHFPIFAENDFFYFVAVCAEENMYDCKSDFIEKQIPKWKCVCAQIKDNKIISKNIG